jgi:hypothetical protein
MSMSPGAALVFTAGDWAEPLAHAASAIVPLATIHSRRPISRVSMGPPSKVTESMTTATGDWLEPRVIPSAAPKAPFVADWSGADDDSGAGNDPSHG